MSALSSIVVIKISTISEGLTGACSALLGVELGSLQLNPAALTTRP